MIKFSFIYFFLFYYNRRMKVQRNTTLSDSANQDSLAHNNININRLKVCSQLTRKSEMFDSLGKFRSDVLTKQKCLYNPKLKKRDMILTKQQVDKIINKNYYTINLSDSQVNPHQDITSLEMALKLLIKQSLFNTYKESNKENGNYRQGLKQFERQASKQIFKLKIQTGFRLKTKKNLFDIQKELLRGQLFDKGCLYSRPNQIISKHMHRLSDNINMLSKDKKFEKRKPIREMSTKSDKWNLKDFFDPIAQQSTEMESNKTKFMKERLKIVQKLQNITKKCSIIEEEDQTKKSVNIFQKFIENVDQKLIKKKKKLQKVYYLKI